MLEYFSELSTAASMFPKNDRVGALRMEDFGGNEINAVIGGATLKDLQKNKSIQLKI